MRTIGLLMVGLIAVSLVAISGEVLTNDTGEDARGLRVTFSRPVIITGFGDALTSVEPEMLSYEFVFSGGVVESWGSQWMNWAPVTASLVNHEWLASFATTQTVPGDGSVDPIALLGSSPTYEEIMSVIAEYPEPDEPFYEPGPDEAIWLTDLEGHADIYDNDSIRVNYADWFDEDQVTKVEVYRNGVRMRFLPDQLDVLTNQQMKTFDGNPLERSPASGHTDHAIFGYEYEFRVSYADSVVTDRVTVKSPFVFSGEALAFVGQNFFDWLVLTDDELLESLNELKVLGFTGIEVDLNHYMMTPTSNEVFAQYEHDPLICESWQRTPTPEETKRILRLAKMANMITELRVQILVAASSTDLRWRGAIVPDSVDQWFANYGQLVKEIAILAEEERVDRFGIGVELCSMEPHTDAWRDLAQQTRRVFSGEITFAETTNLYLSGFNSYNSETSLEKNVGEFWDSLDLIEMNMWPGAGGGMVLEEQNDQRFSVLLENLVSLWQPGFALYRNRYPGKPIYFGEMGTFNYDGAIISDDFYGDWRLPGARWDDQEYVDTWAAYLGTATALAADGMSAWTVTLDVSVRDYIGNHQLNLTPAARTFAAILAHGPEPEDSSAPASVAINTVYFSEPVIVMQGVSDREKICAIPLAGVSELALYPIEEPELLETLTWTVESSHPTGIGVEIVGDTLYIWGASETWSGQGYVTLSAEDPYGKTASIGIPVTVFESDRTFVNGEGVTEYYIPWDSQLDINRILSVEEHMRQYGKDTGRLDRTIRFSKWRIAERMNAMHSGSRWLNSINTQYWTLEKQFKTVDTVLQELADQGVNAIKIDPCWYSQTLTSTQVVPLRGFSDIPTWTDEEIEYVVNEAHRLGIAVVGSLQYWALDDGEWCGYCRQFIRPTSWTHWLASYENVVEHLAGVYTNLGAEYFCPGVELFNLAGKLRFDSDWARSSSISISDASWNDAMVDLVESIRSSYEGPVTWASAPLPLNLQDDSAYERMDGLFDALDVIGINAYFHPFGASSRPVWSEVQARWEVVKRTIVDPILERYNKPLIFAEAGVASSSNALIEGLPTNGIVDLDAQLYYYRGLLEAFQSYPQFLGAFWWDYGMTATAGFEPTAGGVWDWEHTPRLKPAMDFLIEMYAGAQVDGGLVRLDGISSEWSSSYLLGSDSAGDGQGGPDIASMHAQLSERYLYVHIGFHEQVTASSFPFSLVFLDLDGDGREDYRISFGISYGRHVATLQGGGGDNTTYGFADAVLGSQDLEIRLPLTYLAEWSDNRELALSFALHEMSGSQVVWLDTLGYPDGGFYGRLRTSHDEEARVELPQSDILTEPAKSTAMSPSSLSSTPQAIEVVDGTAYIVDWGLEKLQMVSLETHEVFDIAEGFHYVTDIASIDGNPLVVAESGAAWLVDSTTGERTDYQINVSLSGEVLGVEYHDDALYLLVQQSSGPAIVEIRSDGVQTTPIAQGSVTEFISLQMWHGRLLTLDYLGNTVLELILTQDSYESEEFLHLPDVIDAPEASSGSIRGMSFTDEAWYFTSLSFEGGQGKLHVVPTNGTDLDEVGLSNWQLRDFGQNPDALESVSYGEDDRGPYISFANPSGANLAFTLWDSTLDHDLSSAQGFLVNAVSIGAETEFFVEFAYNDSACPEGNLYASNGGAPFALQNAPAYIDRDLLLLEGAGNSCPDVFPWDNVDWVSIHFLPSDGEIRFYGLRAISSPSD